MGLYMCCEDLFFSISETVVMAFSWKWKVESKEFELVIKGGATGVRFFERNNKQQRSIFVLKEELNWLARIGEKLVAVRKAEVFWDQSRADYPRIISQKCTNRHGNFLTIEEFEGRRKCGSIRIPEGRCGEGWDRFMVELRRANSSLRGVREDLVCKKATARRSYAEVVRQAKADVSFSDPLARIPRWLKDASDIRKYEALSHKGNQIPARTEAGMRLEEKQLLVPGKTIRKPVFHGTVLEEKQLPVPAGRCLIPVTSLSTKELSYPWKSGKEPLEGRLASERDGKSASSVGARLELQAIKELLTKVRGEVDVGLARIEAVIEDLEPSGPNMGLVEKKAMGFVENKDMGRGKEKAEVGPNGLKPSKRKKIEKSFAGTKPGRGPIIGPKRKEFSQAFTGARSFEVGESSVSSSILGNYEWVRKACQAEAGCGVLGSSPKVACEVATEMGVAVQGSREVDGSPQTAPIVKLGNLGELSEPGATPASPNMFHVFSGDVSSGPAGAEQGSREVDESPQTAPIVKPENPGEHSEPGTTPASPNMFPVFPGDVLSGPAGAEKFADDSQTVMEGGFVAEILHSGVRDSLLAPSFPGKPVRVSGILHGPVEMLCSGAITTSAEFCAEQTVGEGILALPQQCSSSGLELVPFVEGEPTPLDWIQASEDGGGCGSQVIGKEEEVIFAFSHIVGVSCDGQFDRLKEAIALILAGKPYKPGKNSVGGGKAGRKGMRELENLHSSVNYDGGRGSVSRSRGKGRGNHICL
jgi:hypothetical protein